MQCCAFQHPSPQGAPGRAHSAFYVRSQSHTWRTSKRFTFGKYDARNVNAFVIIHQFVCLYRLDAFWNCYFRAVVRLPAVTGKSERVQRARCTNWVNLSVGHETIRRHGWQSFGKFSVKIIRLVFPVAYMHANIAEAVLYSAHFINAC